MAEMDTNADLPRANSMIWLASEVLEIVDQGNDLDYDWVVDRITRGKATEALAKLPRNPLGVMKQAEKDLIDSAAQDFIDAYGPSKKTGIARSGGLLLASVLLVLSMQQTSTVVKRI